MANIIILTNQKKYSRHQNISNIIKSYFKTCSDTISTFDIGDYQYDYECINEITEAQANILITLDLAGFHFRTQSGEISLNMLPTKNLNLIWGNKPEYAPFLSKKLSLSMLFYDVTGTDHHLPEIYPNMLYYKVADSIDSFSQIWTDFTQEVLQSEE